MDHPRFLVTMHSTVRQPAERLQQHSSKTSSVVANDDPNHEKEGVDLTRWPGWVDLLSEPTHFNTLLKEFGIKGVKIQEVVSLEPEALAELPRPVHALIFLFRWKQSNRKDAENNSSNNVWFAQQTADNACATYAVLNIVNNIPGLSLGPELQAFKDRTALLSPLDRGHEVNAFHFVRAIHNSFATKAELREADMYLKRAIDALRKSEAAKARKAAAADKKVSSNRKTATTAPSRSSGRLKSRESLEEHDASTSQHKQKRGLDALLDEPNSDEPKKKPKLDAPNAALDSSQSKHGQSEINGIDNESAKRSTIAESKRVAKTKTRRRPVATEETAYHFCAYMPIDDQLWKLDGLEPTPELVGDVDSTVYEAWLERAVEVLKDYMAGYEDESLGFNIMAVVHDPLAASKCSLSENVKAIQTVEGKLKTVVSDWEEAQNESDKPIDLVNDIDAKYNINQEDIDEATSPASLNKNLEEIDDLAILLDVRKKIADRQTVSRAHVRDELVRSKDDEIHSRYYRHDYDAFFDQWLEQLAEIDMLDVLIAEDF